MVIQTALNIKLVRILCIFKISIEPDVTSWNGIVADVPEKNVQVQLVLESMFLHPRNKPFKIQ
jgi:hypothetical protein